MDYWSIALAVGAILLALYYYSQRSLQYFVKHGVPYSTSVPFLGPFWKPLLRLQSISDMVQDIYNIDRSAKYVGMIDMTTPLITLRDPELIKSVTIKNFDHFPEHRDMFDEEADPLLGKNLFALRGDRWKEVRSLLSPAFTSSKMKSMFTLMSACGAEFAETLAGLSEREVDLKDAFTRYTNDIIATCAFGFGVNSMKDRNNEFYLNGKVATNLGTLFFLKFMLVRALPTLTKWFGLKVIPRSVADYFKRLIGGIIKAREEQGIVRPDMIQLMLESKEKMRLTLEDMIAQAFIFFLGGFETTSVLMCFSAHEIGLNPEIQERLQKEIDQVLEENGGRLSYEALNSMPYLDAVINETLRRYPAQVMVDRRCAKEFELPPAKPGSKPLVLQPGMAVGIPIYALQNDPQYFEEPEKFNPDRFIESGKEMVNSGAFIPFGSGPRMCIGNRFALLEVKALLFHLLARCDLVPSAKTCIPTRLSRKSFVMGVENGFWLEIRPRSNPAIVDRTSE